MSVKYEIPKKDILRFNKAIDRMVRFTGKSANKLIEEAAVVFVNNAQKSTPPAVKKKNIPRRKFKRRLERRKNLSNQKNWYPPDNDYSTKYRVTRELGGNRKKEVRYFSNLTEARNYQKIKYRGISRAGWYMNMSRLENGKSISSFNGTPNAKRMGYSFSKVLKSGGLINKRITIINNVPNIGRYAKISEKWGFIKMVNYMNRKSKAIEREAKRAWAL